MTEAFDPYRKWLGIPPTQQPPHHYRLLGIELYESDVEVIDTAAGQRMSYLQELAGGQYVKESQKLLNEVSAARRVLLDAKKKAEYDAELKAKLAPAAPPPVPKAPPKQSKPVMKAAAAVEDAEETITLNLSDATAKLKNRATTAAPKGKSSAAKASEGTDNAESKSSDSHRPLRRQKKSIVPAMALLVVIAAGAIGVYVISKKPGEATVAPAAPIEDYAATPVAAKSEDEIADELQQLQKQQYEQQAQEQKAKREAIKFATTKAPDAASGGSATGTATAATAPAYDATFFMTPAQKAQAQPTATPSGTPAATAKSIVDAKAAAKGRYVVPPTDPTIVKENDSLFTPKEGLPPVGAKPKPTATGTAVKPAGTAATPPVATAPAAPAATPSGTAAKPSGTAAPTATASPTAQP